MPSFGDDGALGPAITVPRRGIISTSNVANDLRIKTVYHIEGPTQGTVLVGPIDSTPVSDAAD